MTGKAWYIDGFLAPELHIVRNRQYRIMVEGGASPHDPENYHPLIITGKATNMLFQSLIFQFKFI